LRNFSQGRSFGGVAGAGPLRYAGLGVQLAAAILLGVLLGQWVDRKAGTDGVFTMVGALLAFGGTLYSLIRELSRADKDER
jgi:F0F1-type ATP synthase assembly protein I